MLFKSMTQLCNFQQTTTMNNDLLNSSSTTTATTSQQGVNNIAWMRWRSRY
ncbi:hypothetical protein DFA_04904 [Cavenderia fasciculata]|uniref:Uncharacterized protein n=1 Tax=Cavenderia fasciculata TaxID=261658 RepID=F4PMC4_CACFS|nr:uncharacterized protein DFA_04904 [Cavenderia fasciculata]EGG22774.1 hypothetical protein DFA_04904 [Cavenderia fasciculata]|eukprot:XP_004360625.1 hypothetical protein DFA_04904 [Cavenderia fasciculata]